MYQTKCLTTLMFGLVWTVATVSVYGEDFSPPQDATPRGVYDYTLSNRPSLTWFRQASQYVASQLRNEIENRRRIWMSLGLPSAGFSRLRMGEVVLLSGEVVEVDDDDIQRLLQANREVYGWEGLQTIIEQRVRDMRIELNSRPTIDLSDPQRPRRTIRIDLGTEPLSTSCSSYLEAWGNLYRRRLYIPAARRIRRTGRGNEG